MGDAQVKRIKANELTPDIRNANKGTERGRYALETSLREYGAGRSILVDKHGRIVAGNKTLETAAEIGLDDVLVVQTDGTQIVAVQRMDLDLAQDDKARMLAYADNRVGQLDLDFDPAIVAEDIAAGLDLDLFWQDFELDELLEPLQPEQTPGEDTEPQIDKAEELRQRWGVETGQLWQLGDHRLICGDCIDTEVVARVMGGEKAQVLFTSPPYWVGFEYENESKWTEVLEFINLFTGLYVNHVFADGRIIINTGTVQGKALTGQSAHMKLLIDQWVNSLELHGWLMRYVRFWVKDGGLLHTAPTSDCIDQHTEFVGYFYNPSSKFRGHERTGEPWASKGYWDDIPGAARQSGHIAAFPVVFPERNILLFSRPGESVIEPFSGSGTTIIACENLNRRCRAVEISPGYVAVALERWHQHTGKTPVLIDG